MTNKPSSKALKALETTKRAKAAKAATTAKSANAAKDAKSQKNARPAKPAKKAATVKKAVSKAAGSSNHKSRPSNRKSKVAAPPKTNPPVVGIGASAGGLEAFTQLVKALPADTGLAFVLVQHLEPTHKSSLTPLIARATTMPVDEVREGMHVEPNHIYIIPSNADMSLVDGLLHITGRKASAGHHLPIDYFFTSLAASRGSQAIGVVLSGTASDGTAGIKAIKEAGGLTFAQDPVSAKFDGMPRNAIASGCVDMILTPERIASELARAARRPFPQLLPFNAVPIVPAVEEDWSRLYRFLRSATGVDFSQYKKSTLKRRLARRMAVCKADKLHTYLDILENNRVEVDALFADLLILVTEFFRDPEVFLALEHDILPRILKSKTAAEPIRIWVAGCSTGEEVYSIAISLLHRLGEKAAGMQIQIFGTDVSEKSIEKARHGIYSEAELKHVSRDRLRRYFTASNDNFQINESIRELCVFARHDLTRDAPFSRLDLISCRNVLIYMEPPLQKRTLTAFHYALRPNGILLLGKSENLGSYSDLFTTEDRKNKFFRKSAGASVSVSEVQPPYERIRPAKFAKEILPGIDLEKEATRLVWERYAHAGLVVDGEFHIVHFLGDTSPYLRHTPGKASLQIMRVLRDEFALEVRAALQKAAHGEASVRCERIEFRRDGHLNTVDIEVRPLITSGRDKSYAILFEPGAAAGENGTVKGDAGSKAATQREKNRDREVARLRDELAQTRGYVQAVIRDQEATNEELKTANEEALSSMEELQSTNEELETAKEELQSSNEELVTLNEQLQNRNIELGQLSTDLSNVLAGIDIPIVILGVDHRIRRFTPSAEKLLELIPGDIGRPIGKLRLGVNVPDLDELISATIKKCREHARELQSESGHWFMLRVHPFLAAGDEKVQGVLLAFVDIDEMKKRQQEAMTRAEQSEATAEALLQSAGQAILAFGPEGQIRVANSSAEKMFGYPRERLIGKSLNSILPERFRQGQSTDHPAWFPPAQDHSPDLAGLRSDGSEFPMEVTLSFVREGNTALQVAFLTEVTERKKTEQRLANRSEHLSQEVSALNRLRLANDSLWQIHELRKGLEAVLDAAIALMGADMGHIELLNSATQALELMAYRGFGPDYLAHFKGISALNGSSRSLDTLSRLIIEDVNANPEFRAYRAAAAVAGYRALLSTPLVGTDGKPVGVFSAYFRQPHRPTEQELGWLDLYAQRAAMFIEHAQSDEQMQRVTRAVLAAQEEGNREIARELHDVYAQDLAALGMKLSALKSDLRLEGEQEHRYASIREDVVDLANRLHQASRALHPATVEDLGLEVSLRHNCESFENTYGIAVEFVANNVPGGIPRETAMCLYRIAQESLNNIQKHARETEKIWVFLTGNREGVTLTVKDEGGGFELDDALRKGGIGLISMEERVRAEGGTFTIQSKPGTGTTVTAFVPLEDAWLDAAESGNGSA